MIIDRSHRPAGNTRDAANESGYPKADAAFIGTIDLREKRE